METRGRKDLEMPSTFWDVLRELRLNQTPCQRCLPAVSRRSTSRTPHTPRVAKASQEISIEDLKRRIELLEKTRLEKWDVALVSLQLLGGLGVICAILLGVIKYMQPCNREIAALKLLPTVAKFMSLRVSG